MLSSRQAASDLWKWLRSLLRTSASLMIWWPLWLLVALLLAALVGIYQSPRSFEVPVGTPADQAYVLNFHDRLDDSGKPYRWSDVYGYVDFPGLGGSRSFTMTVNLDPVRSAPVTLIVNGETFLQKTLQPGWQVITLRVDARHPNALTSRDTVLEVRAPDYRTLDAPTEAKGVKIGAVTVTEDSAGGFITPPYTRLALFALAAVLMYLLVGLALWPFASLRKTRLWGVVVSGLFAAVLVAIAWVDRVAVSAAASYFCITVASMLVLLLAAEGFARRMSATNWVARLAGVCVAVGFGLRYGGMSLPQSVIIDMPWHMKWLRTLLSGDWQSLYFPGGLSSVPKEWGLDLLIPKSPLFYFFAAPLGLLPFDLETLVKWLICLLDVTLVLAVFRLTARVVRSERAALLSAALYALMPLAFRAFSYGILPTILAQWLATLSFVWLVGMWASGTTLTQLAGFTVLLCLTLLAFPTVAVFVSMVLLAVALVSWFSRPRPRKLSGMPAQILIALVVAWGLAVIAYYGLYISPVVTSAAALLAPKPGEGTTVRWPGGFPELLGWTADYIVTLLPVLIALAGLALVFAIRASSRQRFARWLLLIWAAIFPVFLLVNFRIDMIGKHLFFTMVPVAVAGGVALWDIGRRGRGWGTALNALVLATVALQGIVFWIDRLLRASSS